MDIGQLNRLGEVLQRVQSQYILNLVGFTGEEPRRGCAADPPMAVRRPPPPERQAQLVLEQCLKCTTWLTGPGTSPSDFKVGFLL